MILLNGWILTYIPTAPDRSPSSISCKRYLTHGTIPTINYY
jgi:hypothetical protein